MSIPEKLKEHATGLIALAEQAADEGKKDLAIELFRIGEMLRKWVDASVALTTSKASPKVKAGDMNDAHREAISAGQVKTPMMRAARKAGIMTRRDLAKALGVGESFLSQVDNGKKRLPADKAEKLFALTGYRWES